MSKTVVVSATVVTEDLRVVKQAHDVLSRAAGEMAGKGIGVLVSVSEPSDEADQPEGT